MTNNQLATRKQINNLQETLLKNLYSKYRSETTRELSTISAFTQTDRFIKYLDNLASNLIDTKTQTQLMTEYPHLKGISPLLNQISSFINDFKSVIEELKKVNVQYMTLAWVEKDKRTEDWKKMAQDRGETTMAAVQGTQYQRTLDEMKSFIRALNIQSIPRELRDRYNNIIRRSLQGGSRRENIFKQKFKNALIQFDKILENTKLNIQQKEKKLNQVIKSFKKDIDHQIKIIKKITQKSKKKKDKIIKRSIHKLKKMSTSLSKKKNIYTS